MAEESRDCLTCGHHATVHGHMLGGIFYCVVGGCTCLKFEQADGDDPLDLARDQARQELDAVDDEVTGPLEERVPWRIGVLDKDQLENPDAIGDNALLIAGWYVHDCDELLRKLQELAAVPAEPADLQQAIHAAKDALEKEMWRHQRILSTSEDAKVAVEAAWPLLEGELRAAQAEVDRLKTVLDVAIWDEDWRGNRSCRACYELRPDHDQPCPIADALDRGTGPDQHPETDHE
jgi:hypothetical protein